MLLVSLAGATIPAVDELRCSVQVRAVVLVARPQALALQVAERWDVARPAGLPQASGFPDAAALHPVGARPPLAVPDSAATGASV